MAFDKDRFSGLLALKLAETGSALFAPTQAEPGAPPAPVEIIEISRPLHRWEMRIFRDENGFISTIEMSPVARVVTPLPLE